MHVLAAQIAIFVILVYSLAISSHQITATLTTYVAGFDKKKSDVKLR